MAENTDSFTQGPHSSTRRRGFALVVTVSLLALLVLVLVALAQLTRIETSIGFNARREAQAQKNATFALERAIGELQRHAGPDERVTATATLLASPPADGKRFWTGVWNSDGTHRTWLISGNEDRVSGSPAFQPDASFTGIELVGANTVGSATNLRVSAPAVPLTGTAPDGTANVPLGRYAWWVGDEGIKARVNLVDARTKTGDPYEATTPDTLGGVMRHQTPQRTGGERMGGLSALPVNHANLERVLAENQLAFMGPGPAEVRNRFHDATTTSVGLLTNVRDGGLKFDLTPYLLGGDGALANTTRLGDVVGNPFSGRRINAGGSDASTFGLLKSWWDLGTGDPAKIPMQTYSPFVSVSALESPGILPVIANFSIFFGIARDAVSGEIRLYFVPLISLWNPYSLPLEASDLAFEISIPSSFAIGNGGSSSFPDTLQFVCPASSWPTDTGGNQTMPGGACWLFSVANSEGWEAYDSATVTNNILDPYWNPNNAFYLNTGINIAALSTPDAVVLAQTGSETPSANFRLENNFSAPVAQTKVASNYAEQTRGPVNLTGRTCTESDAPAAVLYPQMVAHGWYLYPFNQGTAVQGISYVLSTFAVADWVPYATTTRRGYAGNNIWAPPTPPTGSGATVPGQAECVLFEIPTASVPVFSLAHLQHVFPRNSTAWRPRYLFHDGNTLESEMWDRFFFSATPENLLQENLDNPSFTFPNGRLHVYRGSSGGASLEDLRFTGGSSNPVEKAAANLLVKGAFNANSTSVEAWRAILSSFNGVPVARPDVPAGGGEIAGNDHPITRFAVPHARGLDTATTPIATVEAWAGYRRLSHTQIDALATSISSAISARGSPFRSLAEFATSNVLRPPSAVNPSSIAALPPNGTVPEAAEIPGRLTRSDILSAIGPILAVRSDTFLIRAYGETVNPVTQAVEGRAWCEAVVQRVPEYVNSGQTQAPWEDATGNNATFGRRFKIVQFRWLTPSDI